MRSSCGIWWSSEDPAFPEGPHAHSRRSLVYRRKSSSSTYLSIELSFVWIFIDTFIENISNKVIPYLHVLVAWMIDSVLCQMQVALCGSSMILSLRISRIKWYHTFMCSGIRWRFFVKCKWKVLWYQYRYIAYLAPNQALLLDLSTK